MAFVVLLKGVNVGGHRTFRPSELARRLAAYDVVNIGAAGTFVVRGKVSPSELRAAVLRRLPFVTDVMICSGSDVLRFTGTAPFARRRPTADVIHFVSVLARRPDSTPALPLVLPATGRWALKVMGCHDRFVFGIHRREMKAIGYLGQLERVFGVPITTRSWSTMLAIQTVLTSRNRATSPRA